MPTDCVLDYNTSSILRNKLLAAAASEGVAGTECSAVVIEPEIDILNSNTVSGGMRNIESIELGITIKVMNIITGTVFGTTGMSIRGEGYSENETFRSAVSKMDLTTTEYRQFMGNMKHKILDYYSNNISSLIAKANTLASMQEYDEALALLSSYPESLAGYSKVSDAMVSIFNKCQSQYCEQILLSAQAAYARHDYAEATEIAMMIDPESSCYAQTRTLLNSIKSSIDKERSEKIALEKEKMNLEKERIKSSERTKQATITAIKDIATAYFQRQTNYVFPLL